MLERCFLDADRQTGLSRRGFMRKVFRLEQISDLLSQGNARGCEAIRF